MRLALAALLAIGFNNAFAQEPEPCTSTTSECTEWVSLPDDLSRLLVYRTYPLDTRNEEITRALLMVHGGGRNADDYFRTALTATFLADRLNDTVVIAPRFAANDGENCTDLLAENELNWPCNSYSWRVGSAATNNPNVTSFDAVDELLRDLAGNQAFPNLSSLVVAGHSGGGAFTIYYEMANVVHEELGIPVSYVAANASRQIYLDGLRPTADAFPDNVAATMPGYLPPDDGDAGPSFIPFSDADNCTGYDSWPHGLKNRTGYSARLSDDQLRKQLANRKMTYLQGSLDVRRSGNTCSQVAQGPNMLARGLAFFRHVTERHGAEHDVLVVRCGHNHRCMYSSDSVLPLLFPED